VDHTGLRERLTGIREASNKKAAGTAMNLRNLATKCVVCFGLYSSLLVGARAETLKIGVIAPLTGGGAPWGLATKYGPKLLAADINAKGGLDVAGKKYQVEVIAYDDQYKAADAVAAYTRLVNQDNVKFMIIMTSAATMALKQNVEDDKIIALTSAGTAKSIDDNTRYMFRMYSIATDFDPPFIAWLRDNIKERRVVILNPNDETGWDQTQITEKLFKQDGFNVVGTEAYERSVKDFEPLLTKIMSMKPEVIDLGSTSPATAGLIVRQARELGYKGLLVKSSGPSVKDIVAGAGKEAAEGMINLLYVDTSKGSYQRLAATYKQAVGQDPNEMIVTFYDATNVLLHAIQKAGDVNDTTKVAASFAKALPMASVQGDELTLGGKASSGGAQQIVTVDYVGIIKDGETFVAGKVK
jgi:branched-chain amino acid transport system substrate-binding protein